MPEARKRILLVHLYSNGDCLYATAVARQIKTDFPDCHLTWDIAGFCKNIIDLNPYVDAARVVDSVKKNDTTAFIRYKKQVLAEKKTGIWDEVFITSNLDTNIVYYDGTIRGMVLRAYPGRITVPVQPVLVLSEQEKLRVAEFAKNNRLAEFRNVILWEYAPMSGQAKLDRETVMRVAELICTRIPSTCIVLSSAHSFSGTDTIIDASSLSVRENAALSHYCHLLIGCSSGITWLCTSSAGKFLPMIQLLDPHSPFRNIPSIDFRRYSLPDDQLIEMVKWNDTDILNCTGLMLNARYSEARERFHTEIKDSFRTSSRIVYNLLVRLRFGGMITHARVMYSVYGLDIRWVGAMLSGIITAPFRLIGNIIRKSGKA